MLYSSFPLASYFTHTFFLINLFILFYLFWLRWVFVAAHGLSLVAASGAALRCGAWASHCDGFSCCGAQALDVQASVVVARGLSSCGSWAYLLRGMWNLPRPGLEPVSPALVGGFLTTVPPGKPYTCIFKIRFPPMPSNMPLS